MDFFTCVGSIRYENSRSRFLTYLETEFAAVSGSLQVFNSVLARSVGRSVGRSLHPPSRDDRIHASLANVLQALLRELAMESRRCRGSRGHRRASAAPPPRHLPPQNRHPHSLQTPPSLPLPFLFTQVHTLSQRYRSSLSLCRFSRAKLRWAISSRKHRMHVQFGAESVMH